MARAHKEERCGDTHQHTLSLLVHAARLHAGKVHLKMTSVDINESAPWSEHTCVLHMGAWLPRFPTGERKTS